MTLKIRPGVMEIAPYVGGEAAIPGIARPTKLSSNENPLGASPKAIAAFREAAAEMHRYPDGGAEKLRAVLREALDPGILDGIISMHLIENDPVLSKPLMDNPSASDPGAGDWFVLIDATDVNAIPAAIAARLGDNTAFKSAVISTGVYHLMWDLAKSDLPKI